MVCRRTAINFYLEISLCARRAGQVPHSLGSPMGRGAETPVPSPKDAPLNITVRDSCREGSEAIVCLCRGLEKGIVLEGRNVVCEDKKEQEPTGRGWRPPAGALTWDVR